MIKYKQQQRIARKNNMDKLRAIAESPASPAAEVSRQIQGSVDSLVAAMKKAHGGRWRVDINHRTRFVLVAWIGD